MEHPTEKLCASINKVKRKPRKWEKIFTNYRFDKGSISRIHTSKELVQLSNNTSNLLKNGQRTLINICPKIYRWPTST